MVVKAHKKKCPFCYTGYLYTNGTAWKQQSILEECSLHENPEEEGRKRCVHFSLGTIGKCVHCTKMAEYLTEIVMPRSFAPLCFKHHKEV